MVNIFLKKTFLKNKYFLLSIASVFIILIIFVGDYYIYEIFNNLFLIDNNLEINNISEKLKIISYIYILLSVFSFVFLFLNIEQFFKTLKIKNKIYIDELSTLNNRNYLEKELIKKLNPKNYITIMCDIDHFKKINDKMIML